MYGRSGIESITVGNPASVLVVHLAVDVDREESRLVDDDMHLSLRYVAADSRRDGSDHGLGDGLLAPQLGDLYLNT